MCIKLNNLINCHTKSWRGLQNPMEKKVFKHVFSYDKNMRFLKINCLITKHDDTKTVFSKLKYHRRILKLLMKTNDNWNMRITLHKWDQLNRITRKLLWNNEKNDDTEPLFSKLKYHCCIWSYSRKPMIIEICEILCIIENKLNRITRKLLWNNDKTMLQNHRSQN